MIRLPPGWNLDALNRRFGPWISLGLGVLTLVLVRRGASFAPYAALILLAAWALAALAEWLAPRTPPAGPPPGPLDSAPDSFPAPAPAPVPRWRRVLPALLPTLAVSLYQNVLFFLLPLWFGSATWRSANIIFPLFLAAMALFSCFEHPYRRGVLERPRRRALASSVVLFATLVLAGPLVTFAPLRAYFAFAGGLAALPAALATFPLGRRRLVRAAGLTLATALLCAGLSASLVPLLPPIPVQCPDSGMGTGLDEKLALTGAATTFRAGTARVHAWFSVAAPLRYRQPVVFEWYRDGSRERTFHATIVGGRRAGFRTWDWMTVRRPGAWRVDLRTDSGGLIARQLFDVLPAG